MQPTPYPPINEFLDNLQAALEHILGKKLVGLYLYGSIVMGDFDNDISDIDLLAAVTVELSMMEFNSLRHMHHEIIEKNPQWENRLEIAYVPLKALKTFKEKSSKIGIISPGEPFHNIEAGRDWLINWYMVRENSLKLLGPPARAFIEPVSQDEFIKAVKEHVRAWDEWMTADRDRTAQSYAILTLCRGLYTIQHGEQVSKPQAVAWVAETYPQWATLVQNALLWRQHPNEENVDHVATFPETRRFVEFAIEQLGA